MLLWTLVKCRSAAVELAMNEHTGQALFIYSLKKVALQRILQFDSHISLNGVTPENQFKWRSGMSFILVATSVSSRTTQGIPRIKCNMSISNDYQVVNLSRQESGYQCIPPCP